MKVYDVINKEGITIGFEIRKEYTEGFYYKILKSFPPVSNIRRGFFLGDIRWYFQYCGVDCVIGEWNCDIYVCPEDASVGMLSSKELQDLKEHFAKYESNTVQISNWIFLIFVFLCIAIAIIKNLIDHHWF